MSEQRSLVEDFIAESKEHLSSIEDDFLQLEKQGEKPEGELVNNIFRAVHTIKGTSGFLGLRNIGVLSHTMETILSAIREGIKKPSRAIIDILLEGVDKLSMLIDDVAHSDEHDIKELILRLESTLRIGMAESDEKSLQKIYVLRDEKGNPVNFECREITLFSIPSDHHFLYLLSYDLAMLERNTGNSPLELVRNLRQTGEIVDGVLEQPAGDLSSGLPIGPLVYRLLYSTVLDPSFITHAVELDNSAIIPIDRSSFAQLNKKVFKEQPGAPVMHEVRNEENVVESKNNNSPANSEQRQNTLQPVEEIRQATDEASAKNAETLRIRLEVLDELMMLAGELVLVRNQQLMHVDRTDPVSRTITQRLDIVTSNLQETIMRTRMQPIGSIFNKFTRIVRDLGKKMGKEIELEMIGNDVELDKTILETLTDPLTHIIRNCCDHGIETPKERKASGKPEKGHIKLHAFHEGGQMNIEIFDDGKGINVENVKKKAVETRIKSEEELSRMGEKELLSLIFLPGFSTAEKISDLSGRGVGMDVVKTAIEKLSGIIDIKTAKGKGTQMYLRLPLTLAIIPSLIVISGGIRYAIPQINLEELVCLYDDQVHMKIEYAGSREVFRLRNILLPIVHLNEILKRQQVWTDTDKSAMAEEHRVHREHNHQKFLADRVEGKSSGLSLTFAVLKAGNTRFGLIIDSVIGTEEIVVKPMHRSLKKLSIYSGATVLGDGRVSLILDTLGIARHAGLEFDDQDASQSSVKTNFNGIPKRDLLLFKSGDQEHFAIDISDIKRIEHIKTSTLERIGGSEFVTVDAQSAAVIRLESMLSVSPCNQKEEMFLILPKRAQKPCGILVSQLIDIGSFAVKLNTDSVKGTGIAGSAIIKNHMSLVLDMEGLLENK